MSDSSFYRDHKDVSVCKVCKGADGHTSDCIVPNAEQAMDIVVEYMTALRKRDLKLMQLMGKRPTE